MGIISKDVADVESVGRIRHIILCLDGMGDFVGSSEGAEVIFVIVEFELLAVESGGRREAR